MGKALRNGIILLVLVYAGGQMLGIGPATLREMTSSGVKSVLMRQVVIKAHDVRNDYEHSDSVRRFGHNVFNFVWSRSDNREKAVIARYVELQSELEER